MQFRKPGLILLFLLLFSLGLQAQTVETFTYTGAAENWVVPANVTEVTIEVWGAAGAQAVDRLMTNGFGGQGGYAIGTLTVVSGESLAINVGGAGGAGGIGGFNGGGAGGFGSAGSLCPGGPAAGGGGASGVRQGGITVAERVIVAGGGGGGGRDYCNGSCQPCGCGGSGGSNFDLLGSDGEAAFNCGFGFTGNGVNFGLGAEELAGGAGGVPDSGITNVGTAGSLGLGGAGSNGTQGVAGGGGGGGYYGGGGGGGAGNGSGVAAGGGGAGGSFIAGLASASTTADVRAGDGEIVITYTANATLGQGIPIPTLTVWGVIVLTGLFAFFGIRRRMV